MDIFPCERDTSDCLSNANLVHIHQLTDQPTRTWLAFKCCWPFDCHSAWNSHMCCTLPLMVSLWCASTWWRVQKDTTWQKKQKTLKKFSCVGVCLCVSCYIKPQHVWTLLWNVLILLFSPLSRTHTLSHSLSFPPSLSLPCFRTVKRRP